MTLLSNVQGFNALTPAAVNIAGTIIDASLGTAFYKAVTQLTNFTLQNGLPGKTIVVTLYNSGLSSYKVSFAGAINASRSSSFMLMYGQIQTFSLTFLTSDTATLVASPPINHRFGSTYGGTTIESNVTDVNAFTVFGNSLYFTANLSTNTLGSIVEPDGPPLHCAALIDPTGSVDKSPVGFFTSQNASISAVAVDGNYAYFGGSFTQYKDQTVSNLIRVNLITGDLDTGFSTGTGFNGVINALLILGGSIYAGGTFTTYNGSGAERLVKLNKITGAIDGTFNTATGFDGQVLCLATEGTALFVGGSFNSYKATTRQKVAKVNLTSAAVDLTFDSSSGANNSVQCMLIYSGALYIGGVFTTWGVTTRQCVAKLNLSTAALDGTFNSASGFTGGAQVRSMTAVQNTLYCAGNFTAYGGITRANIAAISATTAALDTGWNSPLGLVGGEYVSFISIYSPTQSANTALLIFTSSSGDPNWTRRSSCKLLDQVSGGFINEFFGDISVRSPGGAALGPNMEIVVGGSEVFKKPSSKNIFRGSNRIFKLDLLTGSLDRNFKCSFFAAGTSGQRRIRALACDGVSLYVGGGPLYPYPYTVEPPPAASAGSVVWKVSAETGDIDTAFATIANFTNISVDPLVFSLVLDGTTLYAAGTGVNPLKALNKTTGAAVGGFTTPVFNSGSSDARIFSMQADSSGLYVAGIFTNISGSSRVNIAKLDKTTGSLDLTFSPGTGFNGTVTKIQLFSGSVYALGFFTQYNATSRTNLAKLDSTTAALDVSFVPVGTAFDAAPSDFAVLSGGDLVCVGTFINYNGTSRFGIAKLNGSTAALDGTFNPGLSFVNTSQCPAAVIEGANRVFGFGPCRSYQGHPLFGAVVVNPITAALQNEFLPV